MSKLQDVQEDVSDNEDSGSDDQLESNPLKCRMYERDYPEINELVVVEVKKVVDMGAYCKLLEYNDLEGMLLMSELQRKRIRSVKRVIKEGKQEIVQVLRVNKKKGYIDLSKKRVIPEQKPAVEDRWNKSKAVHGIMRQVAFTSKGEYSMLDLYKKFGWKMAKDYGKLYDAFKDGMQDFNKMFEKYPSIPENIRNVLIKNIEKRLKPKIVTVRAKVEITCFNREGVDAIRKSLKKGLLCKLKDTENNDEKPKNADIEEEVEQLKLVIKLVAPPLFTISVNTLEPAKGKQLVEECIEVVRQSIETFGGELDVKQEPQVIALEV